MVFGHTDSTKVTKLEYRPSVPSQARMQVHLLLPFRMAFGWITGIAILPLKNNDHTPGSLTHL